MKLTDWLFTAVAKIRTNGHDGVSSATSLKHLEHRC